MCKYNRCSGICECVYVYCSLSMPLSVCLSLSPYVVCVRVFARSSFMFIFVILVYIYKCIHTPAYVFSCASLFCLFALACVLSLPINTRFQKVFNWTPDSDTIWQQCICICTRDILICFLYFLRGSYVSRFWRELIMICAANVCLDADIRFQSEKQDFLKILNCDFCHSGTAAGQAGNDYKFTSH